MSNTFSHRMQADYHFASREEDLSYNIVPKGTNSNQSQEKDYGLQKCTFCLVHNVLLLRVL